MTDLSGKTALITGASRGIGAAVAKAYAKAGAHVLLVGRNGQRLGKIDDQIRAEGGQATLLPLDITKFEEVDKIGPAIFEKFGGLDIFVGNAGLLGTLTPLTHTKKEEFQSVLDVNLTANFHFLRTVDPLLQKSSAGRAIFVTTGAGVVEGRAYWGSYALSKAALESMVRVYAEEVANTNVRVNMIDPGAVRTKMRASAKPGEDPMSLPAPEEIVSTFINLAANNCQKHGEIIKAQINKD